MKGNFMQKLPAISAVMEDVEELLEAKEILDQLYTFLDPYSNEINGKKVDEDLITWINDFYGYDDSE